MPTSAEDVVARVKADPARPLSAAEAEVLLAVPDRTLLMDKMLAVHFNAIGDLDRALPLAEAVFAAEQTSENAKNVAYMLRTLGRIDEAIAFVETHREILDPVIRADLLCMMYGRARDFDAARRHGSESLRLKDAAAPEAPAITPTIRPFDPEKPRRNVIVFSLWGDDRRYLDGAQINAIVARHLYPGWSVRFYVDASVPGQVTSLLRYHAADVREAPADWPARSHGLFWRFLVEDDPDVDVYLVRDADSILNIKERVAVEDWLASGRAFHVMRDYPVHSELILAGMWGAHRGNIGDMKGRVARYLRNAPKRLNDKTTDQLFLRTEIWPIVRQSVLMHDDQFDFGTLTRFRDEFRLPSNRHIGQNDWVHRKVVKR